MCLIALALEQPNSAPPGLTTAANNLLAAAQQV